MFYHIGLICKATNRPAFNKWGRDEFYYIVGHSRTKTLSFIDIFFQFFHTIPSFFPRRSNALLSYLSYPSLRVILLLM